jgi:hypothetical protein
VSLSHVGKPPVLPFGLESKAQVDDHLNASASSKLAVAARVVTLAANKAAKTDVDDADGAYALSSYYLAQDLLYVPKSGKGTAGGVATLGPDGKIPAAQLPALGTGWLRGPYGHVNAYTLTTAPGEKRVIADWGDRPGVTATRCQPLVWMSVSVGCAKYGRPVVEVRAGGPADTTYESQVLVARGSGRLYYEDYQTVTVQPCADVAGRMQNGTQWYIDPNFDLRLTAWMYDATTTGVLTLLQPELVASASAWVLKVDVPA